MRTPDEIKIWLATEIAVHYHMPNPEPRLTPKEFMFLEDMHGETLKYIERLETRLAQVERERDAAVADLEDAVDGHCCHCKNINLAAECDFNGECYACLNEECPCHERNCHWEWRGVCPDNTVEDEKSV